MWLRLVVSSVNSVVVQSSYYCLVCCLIFVIVCSGFGVASFAVLGCCLVRCGFRLLLVVWCCLGGVWCLLLVCGVLQL